MPSRWPAFWATLVANLVGHFGGGGQVDAPTWARLLALLTSQVVMFMPLVALRLTLLRDPEHPRPWVALAGFAITPVVRTAVLVGMLVVVGGLEQPQWLQRTLSAFPSQFLVLLVTAVVVGSLREQARTLQRLRQVQQDLARTPGPGATAGARAQRGGTWEGARDPGDRALPDRRRERAGGRPAPAGPGHGRGPADEP
jgi:hypothetical protein